MCPTLWLGLDRYKYFKRVLLSAKSKEGKVVFSFTHTTHTHTSYTLWLKGIVAEAVTGSQFPHCPHPEKHVGVEEVVLRKEAAPLLGS